MIKTYFISIITALNLLAFDLGSICEKPIEEKPNSVNIAYKNGVVIVDGSENVYVIKFDDIKDEVSEKYKIHMAHANVYKMSSDGKIIVLVRGIALHERSEANVVDGKRVWSVKGIVNRIRIDDARYIVWSWCDTKCGWLYKEFKPNGGIFKVYSLKDGVTFEIRDNLVSGTEF